MIHVLLKHDSCTEDVPTPIVQLAGHSEECQDWHPAEGHATAPISPPTHHYHQVHGGPHESLSGMLCEWCSTHGAVLFASMSCHSVSIAQAHRFRLACVRGIPCFEIKRPFLLVRQHLLVLLQCLLSSRPRLGRDCSRFGVSST